MGVRTRIDQAIDGMIDKAKEWFKGNGKNRRNPEEEEAEGEQQNDPANVPDNRTPEQKRADFDKGMNEGMTALAAPNKTTAELQQSLQTIKLKYRMDELNGLLLKEEAEQHTWTLKGKLGDNAVTQQVLREPSKAENEEQVNEEDRAKHEAMAQEIENKLKAITAAEGEDFATFRARLQAEADKLKTQYQPQLREGINLTIELVNSAKEDEKDGDVDVKIEIKPNNANRIINIDAQEISAGNENEAFAIAQFEETVKKCSEDYWSSTDYQNLLKKLGSEDFLVLQDKSLTELYKKIESLFNAEIQGLIPNANFSFDGCDRFLMFTLPYTFPKIVPTYLL